MNRINCFLYNIEYYSHKYEDGLLSTLKSTSYFSFRKKLAPLTETITTPLFEIGCFFFHRYTALNKIALWFYKKT